ncbi:alpha-taxilin-like [Actinia tenebrosa]|uniref:Alpha-taxilin-like n=1 Tax=Actinia tenebrosa TaxID=6105 RepID=A0A6P8GYW7_ACTTE|nr:alpha-taxilin-like [Actinia tenebrosa]
MDAPVDIKPENTSTEPQVQQNGEEKQHPAEVDNQIPTDVPKPQTIEKKSKKTKEEKRNKEEEKRIKLLLRAFDNVETPEAKVEAIARKYVQLAAENKLVEHKKDDLEAKNEKLTKERDVLQSDYNKATLAKSKLESLCRELQKHSKLVKEECQLRTQEEEAKRKELSDKFQTTINDISQQMQENFKRNEQLKIENEELATKLKGLVDQYESREQHVDKIVQHKQLELQLAEAKMAQQNLQFTEQKEKSLMEKQELLQDSLDYRKRFEIMVKQEKELKAQLALYTERFDEFQITLTKSNEMFQTFKTEMDKMTKTIKKLEKENKTLKSRYENTNRSLLAMLEERGNMEKEIISLKGKNSKLENLCRAMQKGFLPTKEEAPSSLSQNTSDSSKPPTCKILSESKPEPKQTTTKESESPEVLEIPTPKVTTNDEETTRMKESEVSETTNAESRDSVANSDETKQQEDNIEASGSTEVEESGEKISISESNPVPQMPEEDEDKVEPSGSTEVEESGEKISISESNPVPQMPKENEDKVEPSGSAEVEESGEKISISESNPVQMESTTENNDTTSTSEEKDE